MSIKVRQTVTSSSDGIYGVPLADPRQSDESLALYVEELSSVLFELVLRYHHPGQKGFVIESCLIGPPRGKHSGIARIELLYHREAHGYRQVFAVTDSKAHGLRLWTEVRRHVRM